MIIVNGKQISDFENKTVLELIEKLGYKLTFIAVEYNGNILPKSEYAKTFLREKDKLEGVSSVGGGAF